MEWQPEETAPEGVTVQTCQDVFGALSGSGGIRSAPMVMSRLGALWFWEPEHWPASVVPTHWRPLQNEPAEAEAPAALAG